MPAKKLPPNTPAELASRLLAKRVIDERGCWNWTGGTDSHGYGRTGLRRPDKPRDRPVSVHRIAAQLWLGFDLSSPLLVLHSCDNPLCFNPSHLFLGTHADNTADMMAKGRHVVPRISIEVRDSVRALRASGATYQEAADAHGIALASAWTICR